MRAKQHFHPMQTGQLIVVNRLQTHRRQTIHFLSVVHNITQTIERTAMTQFFLRLLDSGHYAEAETRVFINCNQVN